MNFVVWIDVTPTLNLLGGRRRRLWHERVHSTSTIRKRTPIESYTLERASANAPKLDRSRLRQHRCAISPVGRRALFQSRSPRVLSPTVAHKFGPDVTVTWLGLATFATNRRCIDSLVQPCIGLVGTT
ncbi:hypothetical protein MRX96_015255 [Rhipicephalus microplus]